MPYQIPLSQIDDNPWQSRVVYEAEALQELADDIRQHGLLQPPVGRIVNATGEVLDPEDGDALQAVMFPHSLVTSLGKVKGTDVRVQIAFGHRRLRALRLNVEKDVDDNQVDFDRATMAIELRYLTDEEMATFAWSENAKRRDLSPVEAAQAIERMAKDFGWTQEQIAQKLGLSRPTVSNRLRLLKLPDAVKDQVKAGTLSERQAMALVPLADVPKWLTTKMEKDGYGSDRPSVLLQDAAKLPSDTLRARVETAISRSTTMVNGAGWCVMPLAGDDVKHTTCDGCKERVRVGEEWRCGRDNCIKARQELWQAARLDEASGATGIAILPADATYSVYTTLESAPEPMKIIERKCPNLRLRFNPYSYAGQKIVHPDGFDEMQVVCMHGEGGRCECAIGAKVEQTKAQKTTADEEQKARQELRKQVEREIEKPAIAAALAALLAGDPGVWRKVAKSLYYRSQPGEEWPLERLQETVATGLVLGNVYYSPTYTFEQYRASIEKVLTELGVTAPWKLTAIETFQRKLDRFDGWLRNATQGYEWSGKLTAESLEGNLINSEKLQAEVQSTAELSDEERAGLLWQIVARRETLLRLKELLPELAGDWKLNQYRHSMAGLLDAAPKSFVFDEALAEADDLKVRYAIALCPADDDLRLAELQKELEGRERERAALK